MFLKNCTSSKLQHLLDTA